MSSDKPQKAWCAEAFLQCFLQAGIESVREESLQHIRRRRLLDVAINAGSVSAKLHQTDAKPLALEIKLTPVSDNTWNEVFEVMASKALFLAKLLAGQMPRRMQDVFSQAGVELLPSDMNSYQLLVGGSEVKTLSPEIGALILHLYDRFDRDPLSLFGYRGRGRDETLVEVKRRRRQSLPGSESAPTLNYGEMGYESAPPLADTLDHFWDLGAGAKELRYSIKADELPAAILKRLDIIPIASVLQEDVEFALEEAYVQVARRAQAYGLGL